MKRILHRVNWFAVTRMVSYFIVGWVTVPLMMSGTATGIRGLVGMLAAAVGGVCTGYSIGLDDAFGRKR